MRTENGYTFQSKGNEFDGIDIVRNHIWIDAEDGPRWPQAEITVRWKGADVEGAGPCVCGAPGEFYGHPWGGWGRFEENGFRWCAGSPS